LRVSHRVVEIKMPKKPRLDINNSDTDNLDADSTGNLADDELQVQEKRLEELERKIVELSARLAAEPVVTQTSSIDALLLQQQNDRIVELQRLIANLGERMTAVQAVTARDEQFNAAVRSVETAAAAVRQSLAPFPVPAASSPERECGCEPCDCVSCACCTFEIWMTHVRVDQMQNPLIDVLPPSADSNILPTGMMEIWMFASIDPVHNIGRCIPDPSPTSYLPLHKQITDPYGPWVSVNCCVGTVAVKKGVPLTVPLSLTAVERETAGERVQPINRDEWGSDTQNVTLDCCYVNYPPILISVGLTAWGQAGGAITGRFMIKKRC
jgi:hypothetical protein